jgi:hypothetical protein
MHVHEFFDLSIMVGTGVILFLIMQFLGYAVVRYLNRGRGMTADRNQGWRRIWSDLRQVRRSAIADW